MRLKTMLVLVFVAAMLFAIGSNAAPPNKVDPNLIPVQPVTKIKTAVMLPNKIIGPLQLMVPDRLNFSGKVLHSEAGPVPGDGDKVYPWLCKAFLEHYECTTEETCGVSTLWVYVTKTDPVQGALLCTMLSQAASSGDRARVEGSCLQMKGSPWCELTGLQVIGVPAPHQTDTACPGCPACPEPTGEDVPDSLPGEGAPDSGTDEAPGIPDGGVPANN